MNDGLRAGIGFELVQCGEQHRPVRIREQVVQLGFEVSQAGSNSAQDPLSIFTMDYTDKQITITTTGDIVGCDRRCTTNVGDATISGWELEGTAVLTEDFQVHLGAGGLDAQWDSLLRLPTGLAIGGVERNSLFSRAPDLSYTLGGRYAVDLAGGAAVIATVDFAHKAFDVGG